MTPTIPDAVFVLFIPLERASLEGSCLVYQVGATVCSQPLTPGEQAVVRAAQGAGCPLALVEGQPVVLLSQPVEEHAGEGLPGAVLFCDFSDPDNPQVSQRLGTPPPGHTPSIN